MLERIAAIGIGLLLASACRAEPVRHQTYCHHWMDEPPVKDAQPLVVYRRLAHPLKIWVIYKNVRSPDELRRP